MSTLKQPITFQTTFSTYVADTLLGEGGSGVIYRGRDEVGTSVAIKVLSPDKVNSSKRKRFQNELTFSSRNEYRNIITVLDHGIYEAKSTLTPFYVMPLYETSLRTLIERGIPHEKVLPYFGLLLDGIEAAHLKNIIHRDLKPENILYDSKNDNLLIADFGIAKFAEDELYTLAETKPHDRLANFLYSAPEQKIRGQRVDTHADIYALGLILNEMFTHEVPLGTGYRPIESVAPEFSYLDELVAWMLRQSPTERPSSVEQIKNELIGRKNEFVNRQKINELTGTIIPVTNIDDDPLIANPIHIVDRDWINGELILRLSQIMNEKWIWAMQNIDYNSAPWGWGRNPKNLTLPNRSNEIRIQVTAHQVQEMIDYVKEWLPLANKKYQQRIQLERESAELNERKRLEVEIEQREARERVLKNTKI